MGKWMLFILGLATRHSSATASTEFLAGGTGEGGVPAKASGPLEFVFPLSALQSRAAALYSTYVCIYPSIYLPIYQHSIAICLTTVLN